MTQSIEDNIDVRLIGRGGHGAWPESTVDPVVMAAATVLRLQTIPSREVAAEEPVIVTVGVLRAGTRVNMIPDDALLRINVRTFNDDVRTRVLAAVERIVKAEAAALGAPTEPEITVYDHFPLTVNDPGTASQVAKAFRDYFGTDRVTELVEPLPSARTSDRSAPNGASPRCSGTSWHRPGAVSPGREVGADRRGRADQPQLQVRAGLASDSRDGNPDADDREPELPWALGGRPAQACDQPQEQPVTGPQTPTTEVKMNSTDVTTDRNEDMTSQSATQIPRSRHDADRLPDRPRRADPLRRERRPGRSDDRAYEPWPESVYAFAPVWSALASGFRLFAVDLPGFGASEQPTHLLSPKAIGAFLVRLIEEFYSAART